MEFLPDSPMWGLYLGVLIGPIFQEDTAVIAAATLSVTGMAETPALLILITIGLFISDIWKYWIGWGALKNKKGQAFAEKKQIANMSDKVLAHTFTTLLTARFIPMTRIPAYIACGFFGVPYLKFCAFILITAILYVGIIFAAFHALGEVLGEKLMWVMPIVAIIGIASLLAIIIAKKRHVRAKTERI